MVYGRRTWQYVAWGEYENGYYSSRACTTRDMWIVGAIMYWTKLRLFLFPAAAAAPRVFGCCCCWYHPEQQRRATITITIIVRWKLLFSPITAITCVCTSSSFLADKTNKKKRHPHLLIMANKMNTIIQSLHLFSQKQHPLFLFFFSGIHYNFGALFSASNRIIQSTDCLSDFRN